MDELNDDKLPEKKVAAWPTSGDGANPCPNTPSNSMGPPFDPDRATMEIVGLFGPKREVMDDSGSGQATTRFRPVFTWVE